MFQTGLTGGVFGAAAAQAGGAAGVGVPAPRLAPGGAVASGGAHPLLPTHPAGVALWVGVGATLGLILLWKSLPR